MTNGDDKLTRRYRELPSEEPPAALDAAIRDAAHRAIAPKWRAQRWAVPVSLAAVLVLAVGVTLRMQQEQPGIETSVPLNDTFPQAKKEAAPAPADVSASAPAPPAKVVTKPAEPAPPGKALAEPPTQKLKKDNAAARDADDLRASRRDAAPTAHAPALEEKRGYVDNAERNVASPVAPAAPAAPAPPAAAPIAPPAPAALARDRQEGGSAPTLRMQAAPQAKTEAAGAAGSSVEQAAPARPATVQSPQALKESAAKDPRERELERIVTLRRDGKHAEADEALAKFRRENPDYRIPDVLWEQVKPR